MVCQTVLFPTCDGLAWRFQTQLNNEGGVCCHMDKAVDTCFRTEIGADGHALETRCDSLPEEEVVRVRKGPATLDSRLVGSKMSLSLLIYTQCLMAFFEDWVRCWARNDYNVEMVLNAPKVTLFRDMRRIKTLVLMHSLYA